jgi:O-antigen/teichoic acid export membrane protein
MVSLFGTNILSVPLSLLFSALLLRYLGAAEFGAFAWWSAVLLLLGNITLETFQSFTLAGPSQTNFIQQITTKPFVIICLIICLIMLIIWMVAGAGLYPWANLTIVGIILIICYGFIGIIWAELRHCEKYLLPNFANRVLQSGVLLLGSVILEEFDYISVPTVLVLFAISSILVLLIIVIHQKPVLNNEVWAPNRRLLSFLKDNAITTSGPQIVLILPGFFIAPELLAALRIAIQMSNLSLLLPTSLYYIYLPRLVGYFNSGPARQYVSEMMLVRRWGTLSLLFAIAAAMFLNPIVATVFPDVDIWSVFEMFLLLSVGNVLAATMGPANRILSLTGRVELNFRLMFAAAISLILGALVIFSLGVDVKFFLFFSTITTVIVKFVAHSSLQSLVKQF